MLKRVDRFTGMLRGAQKLSADSTMHCDDPVCRSKASRPRPARQAFIAVAVFLFLGLSASIHAQNYNPNNYDTAKIIQEMRNPHSDLSLVVAHRGLHATLGAANGVPENSLKAIGDAAQAGIEIVEVDIKVTQDGVPILSHDTSWGREWCGLSPFPYGSHFDPFLPPGNTGNELANPAVNATSLANTRSLTGTTILRDSVSLVNNAGGTQGCVSVFSGVYPPTLQDVLDYITRNKIAVVLALDIKDDATAQICWRVIKANNDYRGNPYSQSVVFKMPGRVYNSAAEFQTAFGSDYASVLLWPFYGTADISPQTASIDDSYGTDEPSIAGFGSEANIIASILSIERSPIQLVGLEVNLKQPGGILTSVLAAAQARNTPAGAPSVGSFNPEAEYIDPSDASKTAQFFNAAGPNSAHCCYKLSDLFYNGAPNGQPSDTADDRGDLNFLIANGDNIITTDSAQGIASTLAGLGRRNISYLQGTVTGTGGGNRSIVGLRVMPIGDSITEGAYGTTGNGYRYPLQQDIQSMGQTIEFVGDRIDGTMTNPQNEGFSGQVISYIAGQAIPSATSWRPNVALIEAGTNDVNGNVDVPNAPSRLDSMISGLFTSAPDATILVAGIPPSSDGNFNTNLQAFNTSVQALVSTRQNAGQHIKYVSMSNLDPNADKANSLHPNDAGYKVMGDNFNGAIQDVMNRGWVTNAVVITRTVGGGGSPLVAKKPVGQIPGTGTMTALGNIASGIGADPKTSSVQFADVNGDGTADYLSIDVNGATTAYFSGGRKPDGTWNLFPLGSGLLNSGIGEPGANVRYADINGDGRADYLTINASGLTRAYFNGGIKADGTWNWIPAPYSNQVIAGGTGAPGSSIQFADINGDGFADYLSVSPSGVVTGYINGGANPDGSGWVWIPISGNIASGVGAPKGSKYMFADLNSDGWDDYIVIDGINGTVHAWLNGGRKADGTWNWVPLGQIAPGNGAPSKLNLPVLADLNGDGKADYLAINRGGSVAAWLNNGNDTSAVAGWLPIGAIANVSPNLRWADIDGDGLADYISVNLTTGAASAYLNGGRRADGSWIWYPQNQIAAGECGGIKTCYVEFGDINGDGKADYLVGDYTSGLTSAWLSGGPVSGGWIWNPQGTAQIGFTLAAGTVIQWVDLNNDGFADMVFVSPNGTSTALQNFGPSVGSWTSGARLASIGTISTGPSLANGYIDRFIDNNNDGRADLLAILTDGSVALTPNLGGAQNNWFSGPESVIAAGVGAPGSQIQFADINGDGKADYLVVPPSGQVTAWLNNGGTYKATY